jgi:hypothetical protein
MDLELLHDVCITAARDAQRNGQQASQDSSCGERARDSVPWVVDLRPAAAWPIA